MYLVIKIDFLTIFSFNFIYVSSNFVWFRDELCLNGDLLHSPALNYTLLDLSTAVDTMRQQKQLQEQPEEEDQTRSSEDNTSRVSNLP